MSYLVDTNICSAYVRGNQHVAATFLQYAAVLQMSAISLREFLTWSHRQRTTARVRRAIHDICGLFQIIPFDDAIANVFGQLHAELLDTGKPPPNFDLAIASTAMAHNLTLVTRNTADFVRIPGWRLDNGDSP